MNGRCLLRCAGWSFLALLSLLVSTDVLQAQGRRQQLDFLNEKLPIPDSDRFVEEEYIESGVGLSYGVDKRLTYLAGDYAKAVQRFEAVIGKFEYKSEIWVYLARAYFYLKESEKALATLKRAAGVMPDLNGKLWSPLQEGLLWEVRQRANKLQVQVDYYSQKHEDFLTLFRLYRFLEAYPEASAVIHAAAGKERKMNELASMASGNNRRIYRTKAQEWRVLADKLGGELRALGVTVTPSKEAPSTPSSTQRDNEELLEATRVLQLKVDYYKAGKEDYKKLFENYLQLKKLDQAAAVVAVVGREIKQRKLKMTEARDIQEELKYQDQAAALEKLHKALQGALEKEKGGPR
jgi:tetratricopeptide (TPR) repeat protein